MKKLNFVFNLFFVNLINFVFLIFLNFEETFCFGRINEMTNIFLLLRNWLYYNASKIVNIGLSELRFI